MKLIIAHLPNDALEALRTKLFDLGVLRTTISEVHSSGPRSARTLRYRGAAMRTHLRPELRLECVATAAQAPAVVSLLRGHASSTWGFGGSVAVLELEELHEASLSDDAFPADPRRDAAVV